MINLNEKSAVCGDVVLNEPYATLCAEEWDMVSFKNKGGCPLREMRFAAGQICVFRLVQKARVAFEWSARSLCLPEQMRYSLSEPKDTMPHLR